MNPRMIRESHANIETFTLKVTACDVGTINAKSGLGRNFIRLTGAKTTG